MGHSQSTSSSDFGHDDIPWFKQLLATVVRRAVVDYVLYTGHSIPKFAKIGLEAREWLYVDNPDFFRLCDHLDISPLAVRNYAQLLSEEDARALRGLDFDEGDGDE